MVAHPLGIIVGGVSCLSAAAVVTTMAVSAGDAEATAAEIAEAEDEPETRQAQLERWRLNCATGDGEACFVLGDAYELRKDLWGQPIKGDGLHRHDGQALRYYRLSCEHGYGSGCLHLARMSGDGRGAPRDSEEAERAYRKACALSVKSACDDLGVSPAPSPKLRP